MQRLPQLALSDKFEIWTCDSVERLARSVLMSDKLDVCGS
jgi:hypothetical protein